MVAFCEACRVGDLIMAAVNLQRGMRGTAGMLYRKVTGSPVRYGN
jgi:hypothetical protein